MNIDNNNDDNDNNGDDDDSDVSCQKHFNVYTHWSQWDRATKIMLIIAVVGHSVSLEEEKEETTSCS